MYDFHKLKGKKTVCSFSHTMFRRGMRHLIKDMKRKVVLQNDKQSIKGGRTEELLSMYESLNKRLINLENRRSSSVLFYALSFRLSLYSLFRFSFSVLLFLFPSTLLLSRSSPFLFHSLSFCFSLLCLFLFFLFLSFCSSFSLSFLTLSFFN